MRLIASRSIIGSSRLRVRELEVGAAAQRVVRAGIDADAAQDAAALVDLVLLEHARLGHQRAGRAGLGAAAARHARRVFRLMSSGVVTSVSKPVRMKS